MKMKVMVIVMSNNRLSDTRIATRTILVMMVIILIIASIYYYINISVSRRYIIRTKDDGVIITTRTNLSENPKYIDYYDTVDRKIRRIPVEEVEDIESIQINEIKTVKEVSK